MLQTQRAHIYLPGPTQRHTHTHSTIYLPGLMAQRAHFTYRVHTTSTLYLPGPEVWKVPTSTLFFTYRVQRCGKCQRAHFTLLTGSRGVESASEHTLLYLPGPEVWKVPASTLYFTYRVQRCGKCQRAHFTLLTGSSGVEGNKEHNTHNAHNLHPVRLVLWTGHSQHRSVS